METAAGILAPIVGFLWIIALALMVFWPLMAFSAMRSLRRISKELAAINETLNTRLSLDR